jgi:hypothetical protein
VAPRARALAGRRTGRLLSTSLSVVGMVCAVVAALAVVAAEGTDGFIPAGIAILVAIGCFYGARKVRSDRGAPVGSVNVVGVDDE